MTLLKLSRSQQLYVLVSVLIVLPLLVGFVFQNELYALYLIRFRGPELQRDFGFTAGNVPLAVSEGDRTDVFSITSVVPDGPFARSGLHAGDIPVGYKHGFAKGFYLDLIWAQKGDPVTINVVSADDLRKGPQAWRAVRIEPTGGR